MTIKTKEFPGTALKERDFREGKILYTRWQPNLQYAWDAGVGIGRYLAELKNGRLIGRKCHKCHLIMIPPRMSCEHCFRPTDEWVYLQDTGTVITYSLSYVTWDMRRLETPIISAVIAIDGASPGMGIMHLLDEVEPEQVTIGMKVQAVWKPAEEREGSILDIKYFKPI